MRALRGAPGAVIPWLAVAACTSTAAPPAPVAPPPDTVMVLDTVRIETESPVNAELEKQVARLQIQLLERDRQLEEVHEQLGSARQEIVRSLAKLQSQASRAEAASGLAEAEIAIETLGRLPDGAKLLEYEEAGTLLREGSDQFAAANYGGALYLANQARSTARSAQARVRVAAGRPLRTGESLFAVPVPLRTVSRSNVRGGPGLHFDVLHTLDAEIRVVGHSYTSQWVRIVDDRQREGWIFHTLLASR